jgi:hypothetical protein
MTASRQLSTHLRRWGDTRLQLLQQLLLAHLLPVSLDGQLQKFTGLCELCLGHVHQVNIARQRRLLNMVPGCCGRRRLEEPLERRLGKPSQSLLGEVRGVVTVAA